MPRRQVLHVPGVEHTAPIPIGVRIDDMVFSSAVPGKDPRTGTVPDDPAEQAALAFANLRALLEDAGSGPDDVAHMTVFLESDQTRPLLNKEWCAMYPDPEDRPARHVVLTRLPSNIEIQLEIVAVAAAPPAVAAP